MKKNLSKLKQTDGKYDPETLDQIWGDTGLSQYGTINKEEYEKQLAEMNLSDLQTHAASLSMIPISDRNRLTGRLIREFERHVSSYKRPVLSQKKEVLPNKDVLKILSEGR